MARPLRIEYEGAVYHILSRGNRSENIFFEEKDKEYFIDILQRGAEKYRIELYAYCVMGNHYHLLMSMPEGGLTKIMHYIGSSYGSYIRRNKGWIGHVFAGRYKSLCVEKENYLLELSRYIHLNPIRARIVRYPEDYLWSSYGYYIGEKKKPHWINTSWFLEEYGRSIKTSQRKYKEFVESGIDKPLPYPIEKVVGQAILGNKKFVKKVVEEVKRDRDFTEITAKKIYSSSIDIDEVYKKVCEYYGIEELRRNEDEKSGKKKLGREMFIYLSKGYTTALNRDKSPV
jgi:REP element-mobilizing transposase RayT